MYRNNLLPLNVSRGRNPFFDTCYTIQYGRYKRACMHVYRKYMRYGKICTICSSEADCKEATERRLYAG